MLTPDYYESCVDDILNLYAQLEDDIISDVIRRMMKTGFVTESAKHQAEMLQNAGLLYDDILAEISKYTDASSAQVKALFEDAGVRSVNFDNQIYRAVGLVPVDIRQSPAMRQTLEAGYRKTLGNMRNLTLTTANMGQTAYYNACNQAYMKVISGAFSYQEAIKKAVQKTAQDGAFVLYPSGHRDRVDVAVRRSVLTGVGQTCREIGIMNAEENDCDLMELSAHFGARPTHAEWQGQIVSLSGRKGYLSLSDIGYGTGDGFGGWNCRHDWFPYFEGYSRRNYTDSYLKSLNEKNIEYNGEKYSQYEISQIQRKYEREIRSAKREKVAFDTAVKETSDSELKAVMKSGSDYANQQIKEKQAKMRDFIQQTGNKRDYFREQNYGKVTYTKNSGNSLTSAKNNVIISKNKVIDRAKEYALELKDVIPRFGKYKKAYGQQISKYVIQQIGYDSLPKVISKKEFKKLIKNNDIIYRGLSSSKYLSAKQASDNFKYGDFFIGTGVFGNGTYGAYDKNIAENYAKLANKTNKSGKFGKDEYSLLEMILSSDVNIADYQTIYKEWFDEGIQLALQTNNFENWQFVLGDIGTYAALKGYDAIKTNGAGGRNYIIILNRGKVIVKK